MPVYKVTETDFEPLDQTNFEREGTLERQGIQARLRDRAVNVVSYYSVRSPLCLIYCRQSSSQWYTIPPPQWPNFPAPLTHRR